MSRKLKPFTPLQQDILSESFNEFQRMLHLIVLRHYNTHGGDLEELFSEAQERFLVAHLGHDELKGELSTWIYVIVSKGLQQHRRREARRTKGHKNTSLESLTIGTHKEEKLELEHKPNKNDIEVLLSGVGEDCKNIIYLLMFPPQDFKAELSTQNKPKQCKDFIREYLHFHMKWTIRRIKKAFDELKTAMEEL